MEKSDKKLYKRLDELDNAGVTTLLERWQMSEFVEFSKEKQLDGRKLLDVTEGIVKLWRPKINANKLILFIQDLKLDPAKYFTETKGYSEVQLKNYTEYTTIQDKNIENKFENTHTDITLKENQVRNDENTHIEVTIEEKDNTNFTNTHITETIEVQPTIIIVDQSEEVKDKESQYQTVKKNKETSHFNNVEEIIKKIVPAKSFLYRNQVKKEATASYLPMDGSPKRRKIFRISGYEYPLFDWKRFSKPEGYYPMKRNSRFFVQKSKERPKYNSISTTEELKYADDHFYEDLCYTDVDNTTSSIPTGPVKPYKVKFQELFQSFKIPFFRRSEDITQDKKEKTEEKTEEKRLEEKRMEEKEPVYENSDSIVNMYDSVNVISIPVNSKNRTIVGSLPVEDYLEPVQVNKDYCDVNYKQKDESILGYIMSIFENRFGLWKETNEATHTDSDDSKPEEVRKEDRPKTSMIDRPLPIPVENEVYYMNIDRTEAENLLRGQPNGTFLLRPSSQPNHAYTLSVSCNDAVHNVGVRRRPDGRMALGFARRGERSFSDVTALLRHHKKRRLLLVANGEVIGGTTLNETPQYYQTPCNIPVRLG